MDIKNEQELNQLVEKLAREAIESITIEVLNLFKTYVYKHVYTSHGSNAIYHDGSGLPTYEFMEAWQWSEIRKQLDVISTQMWFNPGRMDFDMDTFKHGSKYSTPPDARASLMDILNKTGYSSSLWLSVSRKVAYWDEFISDMFDRGELGKIVTRHFLSKGFQKV
jgi:hypothetical protein